jgi:DNA polymerase III epsilon subunit-like protein
MPKNICFLYTETNGLHQLNEGVTKKNIFGFARLVCLNYIIGYKKDNKIVELKKVRHILEPKCINFEDDAIKYHKITMEKAKKEGIDSKIIMKEFEEDLRNVHVIVSHNLPFHIRAIQCECFRTCTYINFENFILIDTISFNHTLGFLKLKELAEQIINKNINKKKPKKYSGIIKDIFLQLYLKLENKVNEKPKLT